MFITLTTYDSDKLFRHSDILLHHYIEICSSVQPRIGWLRLQYLYKSGAYAYQFSYNGHIQEKNQLLFNRKSEIYIKGRLNLLIVKI